MDGGARHATDVIAGFNRIKQMMADTFPTLANIVDVMLGLYKSKLLAQKGALTRDTETWLNLFLLRDPAASGPEAARQQQAPADSGRALLDGAVHQVPRESVRP